MVVAMLANRITGAQPMHATTNILDAMLYDTAVCTCAKSMLRKWVQGFRVVINSMSQTSIKGRSMNI